MIIFGGKSIYILYNINQEYSQTSFPFQVPGYKMDNDGAGSNKQYALSLENEQISM